MRRLIGFIAPIIAIATVTLGLAVAIKLVPQTAVAAQPARGHVGGSAQAKLLAEPLDRFGLDLLSRQAAHTGGNVVVSPFSLQAVLAMALNGARGETAAEMRQALGVSDLPSSVVNQGWADLIASAESGKEPTVRVADSLWLRDGVPFEPGFLAANRNFFAADMRELASDADVAARDVNDWVAQRTAGHITNIVKPTDFDAQTILAAVNTVHVKVKWEYFDEANTRPAPFTLENGRRTDVPMMQAMVTAQVGRTSRYDTVGLDTNGPVEVWVVVPKGEDTPLTVADLLARRGLASLYEGAELEEVGLELPRLSVKYTAEELQDDLEAMGMRSAFSPEQADFSGVADVAKIGGPIWIAKVMQKTTLDVKEEGVEAAAVSALTMDAGAAAPPPPIRADRPYLMILTEKHSEAPLFMAVIRDPGASGAR